MKLIVSQYLRLLKERNELDAILPLLLHAMGINPVSRPQTGVRQNGVDIAAVGKAPDEDAERIFLLVVKKGDIDRATWNSGPQAVRQSLDEIFDVYLNSNIQPEFKDLPITIWVCASGDLLQAVESNFAGYVKSKAGIANIEFYGADRLSDLFVRYLFDESIFIGNERLALRKALALIGDTDYDLSDYQSILLSQLQLNSCGEKTGQVEIRKFNDSLVRINLSLNVLIAWGESADNLKQPLFAAEKTVLWTFHALIVHGLLDEKRILDSFNSIFKSYSIISIKYFDKLQPFFFTQDSAARLRGDSALISLTLFEQISILSTMSVNFFLIDRIKDTIETKNMVQLTVGALVSLLGNNSATSSPRLDGNAIDIDLGMITLLYTGHYEIMKLWLRSLTNHLIFSINKKKYYPISSDDIDDLAQFENNLLDSEKLKLDASWLISSLILWSVILNMPDIFDRIFAEILKPNSSIFPQLWFPSIDSYELFYFSSASRTGTSYVLQDLDKGFVAFKRQLLRLKQESNYNAMTFSPAIKCQLTNIELLASRHFRHPVPPSLILSFIPDENADVHLKPN